MSNLEPNGFVLSEAALYSFQIQDVYPDIVSFCSAIPEHLRPLFLIPINVEFQSNPVEAIASKIASKSVLSFSDSELFSYNTFTYDDPHLDTTENPGSIFEFDNDIWPKRSPHQEFPENFDQNSQVPSDTSYLTDVDMIDIQKYPYRTEERPRHSSQISKFVLVISRNLVALKPEQLESRAPEKVKEKAEACEVSLVSYDKRGRVFTFKTNAGNTDHIVKASLSDINNINVNCDCPFWRWNGPEYHAVTINIC